MSRRKLTIYLTMISLGLVAWAWDRMSGASASPSRVMASDVLPDSNSATRSKQATDPVPTLTVTCASFPQFSNKPTIAPGGRDPFVISRSLQTKIASLADDEDDDDENVDPPSSPPSVRFMEAHRLSAVLLANGSRIAIVDGLIVAEGQVLDGCELQQITRRFAQFACSDANARLIIESTLPVSGAGSR